MADPLSQMSAALADPTRRDLVARLTEGDASVSQLAAPYEVSVQTVSKHLKVLEQAGLISRGPPGHRSPVHPEAEVFDLMTAWIERYRQRAEARYRRLDAVLAELNDDQTGQRPAGEETACTARAPGRRSRRTDGRTRLRAQSLCESFQSRDAWLRSGMESGIDQGYAKLDALLTAGQVPATTDAAARA